MHLSNIRLKNYRSLSNVMIDLDKDISIFVGANNSGKTSVAQAMHFFLSGARDHVTFHDISACRWGDIDAFANGVENTALPGMSVDLLKEDRERITAVRDRAYLTILSEGTDPLPATT